jgi:hypothetical protein
MIALDHSRLAEKLFRTHESANPGGVPKEAHEQERGIESTTRCGFV